MNNVAEMIRTYARGPAQETDRGWERTYVFAPDFVGFQGHFPGAPILPAIMQIMTIRQAVAEQTGENLRVARILRTKFMQTITADMPVTAIWNLRTREGVTHCKCSLEAGGRSASSITMELTAGD